MKTLKSRSDHFYGQKAKQAIDKARLQIAKSIGLSELKDEREIIFTSGGTESINWVLYSHSHNTGPSHFITTGLEHCAVNNYIKTGIHGPGRSLGPNRTRTKIEELGPNQDLTRTDRYPDLSVDP